MLHVLLMAACERGIALPGPVGRQLGLAIAAALTPWTLSLSRPSKAAATSIVTPAIGSFSQFIRKFPSIACVAAFAALIMGMVPRCGC